MRSFTSRRCTVLSSSSSCSSFERPSAVRTISLSFNYRPSWEIDGALSDAGAVCSGGRILPLPAIGFGSAEALHAGPCGFGRRAKEQTLYPTRRRPRRSIALTCLHIAPWRPRRQARRARRSGTMTPGTRCDPSLAKRRTVASALSTNSKPRNTELAVTRIVSCALAVLEKPVTSWQIVVSTATTTSAQTGSLRR